MKCRLIILLLAFPVFAFGQIKPVDIFEIKLSEAYQGNKVNYMTRLAPIRTHLFSIDNNESIILAKQIFSLYGNSSFSFHKFESNTMKIQEHEFDPYMTRDDMKILQVSEDDIYVFYRGETYYPHGVTIDKKPMNYYYRKLNIETLKFGKQKKLLTTIRGVSRGDYSVSLSQDGTKILFEYKNNRYYRKFKKWTDYGLCVFDINMDSLWHREVRLNTLKSGVKEVFSKNVCNNGDVKLLIGDYDSNLKNIYVLTYNKNKNTVDSLEIDTNIRYLRFKVIEKSSDEFLCIGYYDKDLRNIDGIFSFKFDVNSKISNYFTIPFSDELMERYATKQEKAHLMRLSKRQWSGIRYLDIQDFFVNENDDYVLFGERYSRSVNGLSESRLYYTSVYFKDIYLSVIDSVGNIKLLQKIPKRQHVNELTRVERSGLYYREGKYHYFFTTENREDRNRPTEIPLNNSPFNGSLVVYSINEETNKIRKQYLIDTREYNNLELRGYSPEKIIRISTGVVALEYCFNEGKYRMFTFTLNDNWEEMVESEESEYSDDTED